MKSLRIINSAWRLLSLKKLRVILSLTGIAIGIASLIIISAVGKGTADKVISQIEEMGSNLITIDAGRIREVIGRKRQVEKATTLKEKDSQAILEQSSFSIIAAPTQDRSLFVKFADAATKARVIGTTPEYPVIRNFRLSEGRFFTDEENRLSSRLAVIGTKITDNLFNGINPIGEYIRINNIPFEIIGTLKAKGASYDGANEDEVIFIPLKTGMRRLFNVDYIKNIYVQVQDKEKVEPAQKEIQLILRQSHRLDEKNKEDDFTIQNVYAAIKAGTEANAMLSSMITGIGALSLVVGGVGILAVMLLSVKERTSEIGLRMAVGAKQWDILLQFVLEAVILSSSGGVLGVLSGIAGCLIIDFFTSLNPVITIQSVFVTVTISCALGIFFGVYPARMASIVQPVKVLKG